MRSLRLALRMFDACSKEMHKACLIVRRTSRWTSRAWEVIATSV